MTSLRYFYSEYAMTPCTPLTRQQVREVDRLAIQELGIPGIVLMENAGRNATDAIQRFMKEQGRQLDSALILCGGGNNGGDGFVSARHLHNRGVQVRILTHKPIDQLTGDAAINATVCQNMNLDIQPTSNLPNPDSPNSSDSSPARISCFPNFLLSCFPPPDLLIDALLGTGFTGTLRPDLLSLIQSINATRDTTNPPPPLIAAIDLPSGLDCDTGQPAQAAVIADLTITFVAPKLGFTQPDAKPYLGQLEVADIGTPPELIAQITNR